MRLYIGGLSHLVTEKDLKDRFGKFGDVKDVELKTRKDEQGVPYKTFSFINIDISDADLRKCLTVLNKSKWKGGTLHIETAKDCFLHRLAQEQQAALQQPLLQPTDEKQKFLDSLTTAGVDNFIMKAAVPGTEIPGHKNWVVSKFGRVLPVLQLRCHRGTKARTVKYDPSKYSHNIRRLSTPTASQPTPVTELTWEMQGGNDDISQKRRGEFPPYKPVRPKRTCTDHSHVAVGRTRFDQDDNYVDHQNRFELSTRLRQTQRKKINVNDGEIDSDEEIRQLVASQLSSDGAQGQEEEEDDVEVVGHDYKVKSICFHQQQKGWLDEEDEDDCDSADTDERLTFRKFPPTLQEKITPPTAVIASENNTAKMKKAKKKTKGIEQVEKAEEYDAASMGESQTSIKVHTKLQKQNSERQNTDTQSNSSETVSSQECPLVEKPPSDGEDDELDSTESDSDSEYEVLFSKVNRLEISLDQLQKMAEATRQTSPMTFLGIPSTQPEPGTHLTSTSANQPTSKMDITPEEILASIFEDESSEDEGGKKKKPRKCQWSAPLPPFCGTTGLTKGLKKDAKRQKEGEEDGGGSVGEKHMVIRLQQQSGLKLLHPSECPIDSSKEEGTVLKEVAVPKEMCFIKDFAKPLSSQASDGATSIEKKECPKAGFGSGKNEGQQMRANLRRLAAIQQRQNQAEEQRSFIRGALASVDTSTAGMGKHIVFGADDCDGEGNEPQTISAVTMSKKPLFQESQSNKGDMDNEATTPKEKAEGKEAHTEPSSRQLFDNSEDEEGSDKEDGRRFDIRPQFEGQAGQKLMELQSHFGTDERFRMDSRFLEESEEEELAKKSMTEEDESLGKERKKNLSILQSIVNSNQQTTSISNKANIFRDVSVLHYDPSREEHAAFETKTEETKKESKATRRKKREGAQKLPEVSKNIYYNVSSDLKMVFGPKDNAGNEEKISWDQEMGDVNVNEEQTSSSSLFAADPNADKHELSGFKFSFFGDNAETGGPEKADYWMETIQVPGLSLRQDPHFLDSSSEDEEKQEGDEAPCCTSTSAEGATPTKQDVFFFHPEDNRLADGPQLFCRLSQLEEQREQWEERRSILRQEYRKKHKDSRKKMKSS
ncbi:nucleolar protein 8 [Genypterus blacodes]|uniref:nucleolar protein 8 n=1 Tax=Genypterus blacodes TaxID=154954 RepID=UPI003F75C300